VQEIRAKLGEVDEKLVHSDFDDAAAAYQAAVERFSKLPPHIQSDADAGTTRLASELANRAVPVRVGMLPEGVSALAPKRGEKALPTAAELNRRIRGIDWTLQIAVAAVAIVLGLKLLWVDDPVWGGWGSWLAAFFWGLGLHQVATFQSTASLLETIKNK
jgi:hypothetical protein